MNNQQKQETKSILIEIDGDLVVKVSGFHDWRFGIKVPINVASDFSDYQTLPSPVTRHKLFKCEEYQVSTMVRSPHYAVGPLCLPSFS